ncbi:hypothetical protein ACMFMG_003959 [Clarireedia jacksonii]
MSELRWPFVTDFLLSDTNTDTDTGDSEWYSSSTHFDVKARTVKRTPVTAQATATAASACKPCATFLFTDSDIDEVEWHSNLTPSPVKSRSVKVPLTMGAVCPAPVAGASELSADVPRNLNSFTNRAPAMANPYGCAVSYNEPFGYSYYELPAKTSRAQESTASVYGSREWNISSTTVEDVSSRRNSTTSLCPSLQSIYSDTRGLISNQSESFFKYLEANYYNRSWSRASTSDPYYGDTESNDDEARSDNNCFDISPSDPELTSINDDESSVDNAWHNGAAEAASLQDLTRRLQIALWGHSLEERKAMQESQFPEQVEQNADRENAGVLASPFLESIAARAQANGTDGTSKQKANNEQNNRGSESSSDGGVPLNTTASPAPVTTPLAASYIKIASYKHTLIGGHHTFMHHALSGKMLDEIWYLFAELPRMGVVRGWGLEIHVRKDIISERGYVIDELVWDDLTMQSFLSPIEFSGKPTWTSSGSWLGFGRY